MDSIGIVFRHVSRSRAVEDLVREQVDLLAAMSDRVTHCRVVIDAPHQHHRHEGRYRVRVNLSVPGENIVVGIRPGDHVTHDDVNAAVRRAFEAGRRRLERYERRRSGVVDSSPARAT